MAKGLWARASAEWIEDPGQGAGGAMGLLGPQGNVSGRKAEAGCTEEAGRDFAGGILMSRL